MTTLAFILSELFHFDCFRRYFVSAVVLEYPMIKYHDTLQICRTGLGNASRTRMTTLAFIFSELFALDGFRCNFVCLLCNLNTLLYIIMIFYS